MTDLVYLAIACDMSRSISFMYTHLGSFLAANRITESGVKTNLHEMGHTGVKSYPDLADAYAWHARHFARVVNTPASISPPQGPFFCGSPSASVTNGRSDS